VVKKSCFFDAKNDSEHLMAFPVRYCDRCLRIAQSANGPELYENGIAKTAIKRWRIALLLIAFAWILLSLPCLTGCHGSLSQTPPRLSANNRSQRNYHKGGSSHKYKSPAETPSAPVIPASASGAAEAGTDTLPPFFPPLATSTEDLHAQLDEICQSYNKRQSKGPSMRQLDSDLAVVLEDAGYPSLSHYWLEGQDNPGFAIATHIEFIDDLGRYVKGHRFETKLPTPNWFHGWDFLRALVLPRNGRYRLIAFVVAKQAISEKPNEITHEQVEEINHGPNALSSRDWADLEVNSNYTFTAYIYEFYRKSRSDPITVLAFGQSSIQPEQHLASIAFDRLIDERVKAPGPQ
jgi:hypothetical protein